ncbi:MAG: type II secretion system protein, partial [Myxococcota bacterium]|nr:type II secretion system protein [Myxococcota bacterium]
LHHRRAPGRGGGMSRALHHRRRGMTLIEVAVAMAILGLMGILAYGGLAITIQSQKRADVLHERYHAARVFLTRFKRELSMAFVSLHQAEDKQTVTLFLGERDTVIFNTSAHEPIRRGVDESDQLEVEYRLDRDEDGNRAIIRRVKHFIDDRPGRGGVESVAVRGVDDFDLEYFDDMKEDWRNDWDVLIEDAEQKRADMKLLLQAREELEAIRNEGEATDFVGNAAREVAANAGERAIDKVENEVLDQLFLPSRIRIRLVLVDDDDRKYPMETQVELMVTEPLWY